MQPTDATNCRDNDNPVLRDIETAHGLPNQHYVSEAVFEEEKTCILFNNWAGICFDSDVPNAGDVKPVTFMGMPLIAVRDKDGSLHVYQNTCRHRGMILVQEPTNVRKVIRCPYHSWCYDLKGDLKVTPHVGGPGCNTHEGIDPEELSLHNIRAHVWLGVVFVNISGTAPDFDTYSHSVKERWQEFDGLELYGDVSTNFSLQVNTNWKLAVENYCESYHLPWVHPGLNSYSRLEDHYNIEHPGSCSGQGSVVYRQLTAESGETLADLAGLSEKWNTGAEYIALYPNVLLGVHRDHTFALILQPVSANQTIEHVALFYEKGSATSEALADLRQRNADLWKGVFEEDIQVVEGMQAGRNGLYFDGGKFSPAMDGPTHTFHQWVANAWASREQAPNASRQ